MVLLIWPIFGLDFRFLHLKLWFWGFAALCSLQFSLWFSVFVKNDGGFRFFLSNSFYSFASLPTRPSSDVVILLCPTKFANQVLHDSGMAAIQTSYFPTTREQVTKRSTRSGQKLNIPLFKTASGQRTFYYRTIGLWNNLDPFLKSSRSVQVFKHILKNKLLDNFVNTSSISLFLVFLLITILDNIVNIS